MATSSLSPVFALTGAPPAPRLRADPRGLLLLFGGLVIAVIIGAAAWFLVHLRATAMANVEHEARLVGAAAGAAAIAIFVLLAFLYRLFGQVTATNAALRASEEATRRQADILSTLTENLPIGVSLVGSDMHYLAFNRLFLDQSGLPADAFKVGDSVGKLVRLLAERGEVNPDGREVAVDDRINTRLSQRRAGQPAQFERKRTDGRIIDVRIVPLPGGGFVSTRVDVTDKKKIEQQLIQAQKMEAIGNLTGGLAHDFNNLLGIIIGNLDLARPLVKATGTAEELVGEALDAAARGAELTRRLLAFARRQPLRPENIDVNALVAKTLRLAGRTLGDKIIVALEPAPDVWPISADPAQLEAAMINLVNNARDAMPQGGRLTIATGNRHLDADYVSAHPGAAPGDHAMIVVSDTGNGMPPEIVARIFEPFYTTKGRESGMGLGLSMVFGFMQQSGGHITVHSAMGVGTSFRLYLPREPAAAAQLAKAAPLPVAKGASETVLVVEDNAALRRVVTRQLTDLGYRVAEADCADAAYAFLAHERADMLFTDIVLPGKTNGFALARSVTERWPATKILLTSGFPDAKLSNELEALGSVRLLNKPYRKEELAQALRDVLDA
jgi:signal transduction histidine kinase